MQCAYDGAALTYARNQALAYMGITDRPGFAEVTTFATDGTTINFYAHYAVQSENGAPEYHQCLISSINLTKSFQDFKEGWKQLRNLQDRARNSSYALLHQLKSHWASHRGPMPAISDRDSGFHDTGEESRADCLEREICLELPLPVREPARDEGEVPHLIGAGNDASRNGVVDDDLICTSRPQWLSDRAGSCRHVGQRRAALRASTLTARARSMGSAVNGAAKQSKSSSRGRVTKRG
ncbi:hypothetical protein VTI28DRAFT_5717 [Corynascus sepedonium]